MHFVRFQNDPLRYVSLIINPQPHSGTHSYPTKFQNSLSLSFSFPINKNIVANLTTFPQAVASFVAFLEQK